MQWFRITKELSPLPSKGKNYRDWKEDLSIEGKEQCVYCSINTNSFGGIRNFHVEHYKPKAADKFPELENEFSNLFFACSICNSFKGDDWPGEPAPELDNTCFPNPSKISYSEFLSLDTDCKVQSDFITGKFLIEKLYLNRAQLILERKSYRLHETLKEELEKLKIMSELIKKQDNANPFAELSALMIDAFIVVLNERNISPYTQMQTKR